MTDDEYSVAEIFMPFGAET